MRYVFVVTRPLAYGEDYQEDVTLSGGTRVRLRLLRPSDKAELSRGLSRLSRESQYRRFLAPKERLTDEELAYLTEVDGYDHVALAAGLVDARGQEGEGVGVARFVRLPDEPSVAEPAVVVVDAMQGLGLGGILVRRLIEAARERGIERFRSEFLAENEAMREIVDQVSQDVTLRDEGAIVVAEFPLPEPPSAGAEEPDGRDWAGAAPIFAWLRLVADRTISLRQRWLRGEPMREVMQRLRARFEGD